MNACLQSQVSRRRTKPPAPGRAALIDLPLISLLWFISLIIVTPLGNFPLNDDWSYGLTVKHLIETGSYYPTANTAMPLLVHVLWGSLFWLPKGFSFTALRLSTLVAALVGIVGLYYLMRDLRQPRWLAVLAALTLGGQSHLSRVAPN